MVSIPPVVIADVTFYGNQHKAKLSLAVGYNPSDVLDLALCRT